MWFDAVISGRDCVMFGWIGWMEICEDSCLWSAAARVGAVKPGNFVNRCDRAGRPGGCGVALEVASNTGEVGNLNWRVDEGRAERPDCVVLECEETFGESEIGLAQNASSFVAVVWERVE